MSGILAEIFMQLIEEHNIKHWMENGDLLYYKNTWTTYLLYTIHETQIIVLSVKK